MCTSLAKNKEILAVLSIIFYGRPFSIQCSSVSSGALCFIRVVYLLTCRIIFHVYCTVLEVDPEAYLYNELIVRTRLTVALMLVCSCSQQEGKQGNVSGWM